jgi:GR25 family glycosyltransferase involved in LPS biosynthesis
MSDYNSGLNNFDIIYYINLDHRTDRYDHINKELSKTNIDPQKINKITGIYMKDFGILGCAKSHILALEQFLATPDNIQTCIIFEDDFTFTKSFEEINILINNFFNNIKEYDVLMLASNTIQEELTEYSFITKIINAQTLSGYSVSKKFAPTLLNNYITSVNILEYIGYKVHNYCFDIFMKQLQPTSLWYCLNPKIGKQIKSYSDIENQIVNYNC